MPTPPVPTDLPQPEDAPDPAGQGVSREVIRVAPTTQLSRRALLAAFGLMIAVGLGVYALFPANVGGPPLPVRVQLDQAPVKTTGGQLAVLTEVIKVTSELDQPIGNLTIILNGHYWLTEASPLGPGETLTFPLGVFTDKRSSRRFDPESHKVTKVVIGGQLPSKSRGVSEFKFD